MLWNESDLSSTPARVLTHTLVLHMASVAVFIHGADGIISAQGCCEATRSCLVHSRDLNISSFPSLKPLATPQASENTVLGAEG